eukprot:g6243.t1
MCGHTRAGTGGGGGGVKRGHDECEESAAWGSLRPPTARDVAPRKLRRGLDRAPAAMEYIVVLDFEWTADKGRRVLPVAEITQFPSVLVDLRGAPCACIAGEFDTFVRPTLNPRLSAFATELTGITQAQVDAAPAIGEALRRYTRWLAGRGLVDAAGQRVGRWVAATWGDVDIMSTLRLELAHKGLPFPAFFDRWIDLKNDAIFKRHFGWRARGGLRHCVDNIAPGRVAWDGRAHNGLVDSRNTAKIVLEMARGGFRFVRATRGLDADGLPFGQRLREGGGGARAGARARGERKAPREHSVDKRSINR